MSINNQIFDHYRQRKNRIKEAKVFLHDNNYHVFNFENLEEKYKIYKIKQELKNASPIKFNKWQQNIEKAINVLLDHNCI
jgi:hypothetical protein